MTIDDKIRDGKLQYDINREAAKTSALSSRKIDKSGEKMLPFLQRQIIALSLHFIIIIIIIIIIMPYL